MSNDEVIKSWSSAEYAASWKRADGLASLLEFPWAIATTMIGRERAPRLAVDVGSGPGSVLSRVLDAYPDCQGLWIDASPGMLEQAEEALGAYGDRVEFIIEDAARLEDIEHARGADVIFNSRIAHHFDLAGLTSFYTMAAGLLQPGGWLVTLDHIRPPGDWNSRYRDVLPLFAGPSAGKPSHPHYFEFPTPEDHIAAFRQAGLSDCDVAWRAFYTCLFLGRLVA